MRIVPVQRRDGVEVSAFDRVAVDLARHGTLQDVWDWCRARSPPLDVTDVVVQDEYTHDVVVVIEPGLVAVYDAT